MSASVAASVVGIAAGVNSLTGGGITSALGMGPNSTGSGAGGSYDPAGQYRQGWASQLNQLVNDPNKAMSMPGFQDQLALGQQSVTTGLAAQGLGQSGAEQIALNKLGQSTFQNYYNNMFNQLAGISGAVQNPAQASALQMQGNQIGQNMLFQGASTLTSGLGGLYNAFGSGGNQTSDQNIAGYGSSGASYANSFGSDTQFGSYDSGAYQGPV
jgi:hypothetical protein